MVSSLLADYPTTTRVVWTFSSERPVFVQDENACKAAWTFHVSKIRITEIGYFQTLLGFLSYFGYVKNYLEIEGNQKIVIY